MKRIMILLLSAGLAAACGTRVSPTTGNSDGEGPVDDGPPAENDADVPSGLDVGAPNPCVDGEVLCDGKCVNTMVDDDNCGRCGNECLNVANLGGCEEGMCPPNYVCGGSRTDYRDCNEVCESQDRSCQDGIGCSGEYQLFYDLRGVEFCAAGGGGDTLSDATCSAPIDWENKGGLNLTPPVAVACCCLQE